jgi:hypothetical protein
MSEDGSNGGRSGRWQRRERRQRTERERLKKHRASLRRVYLDAIRKRAKAGKGDSPKT